MTYYNYISLYFFGGDLNFLSPLNEVFYLDVSRPFNIASPPWNDLTVNEGIPIKIFYTTALLRVTNNEKTIYLFGGYTKDDLQAANLNPSVSFVYKFKPNVGKW